MHTLLDTQHTQNVRISKRLLNSLRSLPTTTHFYLLKFINMVYSIRESSSA